MSRRTFAHTARRVATLALTLASGCSGAATTHVTATPPPPPESAGGAAPLPPPTTPPPTTVTPGTGLPPGPESPPPTTTAPTVLEPGPRFLLVPMRLLPVSGASGPEASVDLELRADGTLYSHGQPVGQIVGDRVVSASGREILAVAADGTVTLNGTPTRIRLLDSGEIVRPDGATLSFGDDGVPRSTVPGQPPTRGALQLQGLRPEARRTAGLLALIVATVALP